MIYKNKSEQGGFPEGDFGEESVGEQLDYVSLGPVQFTPKTIHYTQPLIELIK
ncbi:MAG: hypothetical protein Kow00108_14950 [Calditrichia bacterium]